MDGTRDYGRLGWIGIGTPQANPTVEAEMAILLPPGCALATTRLRSPADAPSQRLVDYLENLGDALAAFDSFRPDSFGFACTGTSYLVGVERETELADRWSQASGYPVITATMAIDRALSLLGAKRIAIVAPYPDDLITAGRRYWESRGYDIAALHRIETRTADTRGIYDLRADAARPVLDAIDLDTIDAVLLSGTGLATLPLIRNWTGRVPLLSSNLCLAAHLYTLCGGEADPATFQIAGLPDRIAQACG